MEVPGLCRLCGGRALGTTGAASAGTAFLFVGILGHHDLAVRSPRGTLGLAKGIDKVTKRPLNSTTTGAGKL